MKMGTSNSDSFEGMISIGVSLRGPGLILLVILFDRTFIYEMDSTNWVHPKG